MKTKKIVRDKVIEKMGGFNKLWDDFKFSFLTHEQQQQQIEKEKLPAKLIFKCDNYSKGKC